jgi:hypothetical protein
MIRTGIVMVVLALIFCCLLRAVFPKRQARTAVAGVMAIPGRSLFYLI